MQYTITAPIPGVGPLGEIAAQAETAVEALFVADEIARGGRPVLIRDRDGEFFGLDQFRAIVQRSGCAEHALGGSDQKGWRSERV